MNNRLMAHKETKEALERHKRLWGYQIGIMDVISLIFFVVGLVMIGFAVINLFAKNFRDLGIYVFSALFLLYLSSQLIKRL
jgi:hypothetical protein